jgi:hypothetical protein
VIERTVVEAASWRLAVLLARRHPNLVVRREHPGDGQYEVLALRSGRGCVIMLNREGTIQVHGRDDGAEIRWEPLPWEEVIRRDMWSLVEALEDAAGLPPVDRAAASTPRVLVYRILSALAGLHTFADPVEITMGALDTSGYGAGPADWLEDYPEIRERAANADSSHDEPRFAYWRAAARDLEVAFDTNTGDVWSISGDRINLATTYEKIGRRLPQLLAVVLELGVQP